ncbi:peptidoglycan hydrolase-like protein with peptidoglycan-binding domain [Catenuloplanes nepalensis]|uniref:Peptidoglycan hydrolase-like protein with peptidoglycan-binding domain n=1 Tax=Catenuloplanes nepalensis TaxID=587533 RepID=A0ABT9MUT1_9ACTN|nr:penicillin-insensitive murein endopeptidase [Catenuloplanes nepalensis]MDP9795016.1 peptidoglycan hydrolase-like protein with peptidoglycan-binding domain [Catenuloplanes nepalensis]
MRTLTRLAAALTVAIGIVLVAPAAPASAFPGAFFHTQRQGNRGVDTQAVQHLLTARGHATGADGVFGSGTATSVRAFQTARGLTSDGIVGPQTWGALIVTVRQGDNGAAVRAVQVLLNKKRRLSLAVDGDFGSGTHAAVVAFQNHAGITADGIVGPTTWQNLVWHYAYPSFANMCDQNPDGNGTANWGTGSAIGSLEAAAASFTGNGQVPLGDVSFEHGGDIPGHSTHETGLDVDVWPIRTDSAQCTAARITWESAAYDRAATRLLAQRIRATGRVESIYFNDPTLISEGLTTSYPNHDNHLHINYL